MAAPSPPVGGVDRNAAPFLHGPELDAIAAALDGGQFGHGAPVEQFERELADYLGVPDVVAVSCCTTALQIALTAAQIGPGCEVIVPSQTFCATIQAILATGAVPRFADIDPRTLSVTPETVLEALTPATRAVLPVLYGGRAVNLSAIHDELNARGSVIVEDAAHAFGSQQGTVKVGATGALTCFSFGPIKNLTCIEGGALIPRNEQDAHTARRLRLLGIAQPQAQRIRTTTYDVQQRGLRATMSSVHAAVGSAQLKRFPGTAAQRRFLWYAYQAALTELEGVTLIDVDIENTVPFNCVIRVNARDTVFTYLQNHGVGVGVHYPPNHLQTAFRAWYRPLPATETTAGQIMSLPFHPALNETDVQHVARLLRQALRCIPELSPRT
jgi:dTDP-4-amino-4,6-dideoxygalactose transaminase